jgi:hypothetical protein
MAQKQSPIQHSSDDPLAQTQIDEVARELGIDPSFVQQTLSQQEGRPAAELNAASRRLRLSRRRLRALPALLTLLALVAIPTGQLLWLTCLVFLPFLVFAFPPLELHSGYWQLRCPKCGVTVGRYFRGGAASRGKRMLRNCHRCAALRWLIVEPEPTDASP